jgi:hypothetical protein
MTVTYAVQYIPRNSSQVANTTVKVDGDAERGYYATNLALWGCGKTARTPQGAIQMLAQDMATIVNAQALPDAEQPARS